MADRWLDAPPADIDARITRIAASFTSRAALERAFADAVEAVGPPSQVVVSAMPSVALEAADIATLSDDDGAHRAVQR